jgi:dolichol-phosphate mannosyltransferase
MENKLDLSVVIPAFNEETILDLSLNALREELDALQISYEVIVVNDGSTDGTLEKLSYWQKSWNNLKILTLVSNRGHMAALTAGLDFAAGDWVCTIDADLQDPVHVITEMYLKAKDLGVDVIYGVRINRDTDSFFKKWTASIYYKIMDSLVGQSVHPHSADCRLMSRRVVNSLKNLSEKQKIYRLLVPWLGFPSSTIEYQRSARIAGSTHYKLRNMVSLAINSVTSFSASPLRFATWSGIAGAVVLFVGSVYVSVGWITGNVSPGWTSMMFTMLLFGSIQLICVGILGEYISKIFTEVQNRPIYYLDNNQEKFIENER